MCNKARKYQIAESERLRWAKWIGDVLPKRHHPKHTALLWAIAEAMERNNFGVVAKPDVRRKE
jgi:hypothetical protein